jgi:hypothetical protein
MNTSAPAVTTTTATTTSRTEEDANIVGTIQLRRRARITWTDDVVDNEGAGKRKSNKC